ncbi:hypothetical protein [Halobaculum magnesiiphilum]|uniref:Uncharacterized protein n=1 Tax=Halobaculum magnesiiphilum TaxID=1017351 RepID=A0A8T8WFH4_9EURY|nr:hypothetical protein [Halobaculum magnesiiphilum]QZP38536.1 hypothetical protein K6T50_05185 [Halobaculum magnesiiphilum]
MGLWYNGYWYDVDTEAEAKQLHDERGVTIATDQAEVEAAITDGEYSPPDQRLLADRLTDEDGDE